MRIIVFSILFLFSSFALADADILATDHEDLLKQYKVGNIKNQAYCYLKDGKINGHRVDELQRIASVTKLFTTFMVTETLDLNQTYLTRIHIVKDHLHIEGGKDPYFEEEKLLLLFQALNRLGYTSFKRVTFDANFIFSDVALGQHEDLGIEHVRSRLAYYLNQKNKNAIKLKWEKVKIFAEEEGVVLDETLPSVKAMSVTFSQANPLNKENPALWVHKSRALGYILKAMNVMSKNHVAQNLFLESSKVKSLSGLLSEKGINLSTVKFYNGSGLPLKKGSKRWDNLATCSTVLNVISFLEGSLEKKKLMPFQVMAVNGGYDSGTFRNRFVGQPETHMAVISKTGTVNQTSALAGLISMDTTVPFAILNHTYQIDVPKTTRNFQDAFVARMFHHLGEPVPVPYTKISTFPWDGSDFLVQADLLH